MIVKLAQEVRLENFFTPNVRAGRLLTLRWQISTPKSVIAPDVRQRKYIEAHQYISMIASPYSTSAGTKRIEPSTSLVKNASAGAVFRA